MDLMYAIIDSNKQVIKAYVGDIKEIENQLKANKEEAIQITVDNSPANSGDYYDGFKFVKELSNV